MHAATRTIPLIPLLIVALAPGASAQIKAASSTPSRRTETSVDLLRRRNLLFPVAGASITACSDNFSEARDQQRLHHALDIPAARGTPVLAADSGRIIKLHTSKAGGLMVYATDPDERFIYHYAHLDHYRAGLSEGMTLTPGDTLGYVGTTGNAPPNVPHLHFAIFKSKNILRWSRGTPINPYLVFR